MNAVPSMRGDGGEVGRKRLFNTARATTGRWPENYGSYGNETTLLRVKDTTSSLRGLR